MNWSLIFRQIRNEFRKRFEIEFRSLLLTVTQVDKSVELPGVNEKLVLYDIFQ